jgi:hypothetical protein
MQAKETKQLRTHTRVMIDLLIIDLGGLMEHHFLAAFEIAIHSISPVRRDDLLEARNSLSAKL